MYKEVKASVRLPERSKKDSHRSDACHGINDLGLPESCYYDYKNKIWRDWYSEGRINIEFWLEKIPQQNAEELREYYEKTEKLHPMYANSTICDMTYNQSYARWLENKLLENYAQSVGVSEEEISCSTCEYYHNEELDPCIVCKEHDDYSGYSKKSQPQPKEEEKCKDTFIMKKIIIPKED
jgi:hypothetical protein